MATKKSANNKKTKLSRRKVKTPVPEQAQTIAELRRQLAESLQRENVTAKELRNCKHQLTEALEQQTATSEILKVIASSGTDLQPMLDVVAESAARLCNSQDAQIYRIDGEVMRKVASCGSVPDAIPIGNSRPITRGSNTGRAIVDRQAIHIHDMLAEREEEFPEVWHAAQQERIRTVLAVPLLREGSPIGGLLKGRREESVRLHAKAWAVRGRVPVQQSA